MATRVRSLVAFLVMQGFSSNHFKEEATRRQNLGGGLIVMFDV